MTTNKIVIILIISYSFTIYPLYTYAVPTPDIIVSVLNSVVQISGLLSALVVGILGILSPLYKEFFTKKNLLFFIVGVLILIIIGFGSNHYYKQQPAYQAAINYTGGMLELQTVIATAKSGTSTGGTTTLLTTKDFINLYQSQSGLQIIDIREDDEFNNGHIPGSLHIRFADILWSTGKDILSNQNNLYLICANSMRGETMSKYLATFGFHVYYLENGSDGYVDAGGKWTGDDRFDKVYSEKINSSLLSQNNWTKIHLDNFQVFDTRVQYQESYSSGVIFSIIRTESITLEQKLSALSCNPRKEIITLYNSSMSLFDGFLLGLAMEKKGCRFKGMYFLE